MLARKTDGNHKEIARAFLDLGCSVAHTHMVGDGFPDLVIGRNGKNVLVEVKNGAARGKLRQSQKEFVEKWRGTYVVVESWEDVVAVVGRICRDCL